MPKRILLADDSLTIQKVVELTFSDSDFDLVCVSNGQRALEEVREERPDLILADVVMPEKNGYEVCEAIKGNPLTARIPVVLLSGTFEPFDRDRAERIGADAIVSKPFDSQQLLAQVELLLSRTPKEPSAPAVSTGATTIVVPMTSFQSSPPTQPIRQVTEPLSKPAEDSPPFEAGFTAEDFTGTVRLPTPEPADAFEEEYGRGGVDSAIEAFEKEHPGFGFSGDAEIEIDDARLSGKQMVEESGSPSRRWLADEPEKAPAPPRKEAPPEGFDVWTADDSGNQVAAPSEATAALRGPLAVPAFAEEIAAPDAAGGDGGTVALKVPLDPPRPEQPKHELETLAQENSIPELTEMLSSVSRTNGGLSDADIERLAAKVVEKLSDKVVREIAWEVIPDMAEIVIKQRIKELESGIE
jgi:CheY-like chemotaxis protein